MARIKFGDSRRLHPGQPFGASKHQAAQPLETIRNPLTDLSVERADYSKDLISTSSSPLEIRAIADETNKKKKLTNVLNQFITKVQGSRLRAPQREPLIDEAKLLLEKTDSLDSSKAFNEDQNELIRKVDSLAHQFDNILKHLTLTITQKSVLYSIEYSEDSTTGKKTVKVYDSGGTNLLGSDSISQYQVKSLSLSNSEYISINGGGKDEPISVILISPQVMASATSSQPTALTVAPSVPVDISDTTAEPPEPQNSVPDLDTLSRKLSGPALPAQSATTSQLVDPDPTAPPSVSSGPSLSGVPENKEIEPSFQITNRIGGLLIVQISEGFKFVYPGLIFYNSRKETALTLPMVATRYVMGHGRVYKVVLERNFDIFILRSVNELSTSEEYRSALGRLSGWYYRREAERSKPTSSKLSSDAELVAKIKTGLEIVGTDEKTLVIKVPKRIPPEKIKKQNRRLFFSALAAAATTVAGGAYYGYSLKIHQPTSNSNVATSGDAGIDADNNAANDASRVEVRQAQILDATVSMTYDTSHQDTQPRTSPPSHSRGVKIRPLDEGRTTTVVTEEP